MVVSSARHKLPPARHPASPLKLGRAVVCSAIEPEQKFYYISGTAGHTKSPGEKPEFPVDDCTYRSERTGTIFPLNGAALMLLRFAGENGNVRPRFRRRRVSKGVRRENWRVFSRELLMWQFGRWIESRWMMNMDEEVSIIALVTTTHGVLTRCCRLPVFVPWSQTAGL